MADNYSTHTGTGLFLGRATRSEYWGRVAIISGILLLVLSDVVSSRTIDSEAILLVLGSGIVAFILVLPVTVRRYHDLDMSGWWVLGVILLGLIPFINCIVGIVNLILLGFIRGTEGRNNYGPDPLLPEPEEEETPQPPRTQTHVSSVDIKTYLEDLKTLLDKGVISYEEYSAQRERILKDI